MKAKILCSVFFITIILTACNNKSSLEDNIRLQVKNGLPQLAVMDTVFLVEYTNLQKHWIWSDDFYTWIQLRSAILGIMRPLALFQQKTLHEVFCS